MDSIESEKAIADLAHMMGVYYKALLGEGFDPKEAFRLTLGYQHAIAGGKGSE